MTSFYKKFFKWKPKRLNFLGRHHHLAMIHCHLVVLDRRQVWYE